VKNALLERMKRIQGFAVWYPLNLLSQENLGPGIGTFFVIFFDKILGDIDYLAVADIEVLVPRKIFR